MRTMDIMIRFNFDECATGRIREFDFVASLLLAGSTLGSVSARCRAIRSAAIRAISRARRGRPIPTAPPARVKLRTRPRSVLRTSSDLVRIDVEVTDRSGKPLKGLQADQFTITDDGQPQKISIFSYEDIEASKPRATATRNRLSCRSISDAAAAEAAGEQVATAACWCSSSISPRWLDDLIRAHDAAEKFVKQQMTKADLVSVVVFQLEPSRACEFYERSREARKSRRAADRAPRRSFESSLCRGAEWRIRRAAG